MTDLSHAVWRKARRSQHNGGCVEVAANLDEVGRAEFAAFLADAKTGRFDLEPTTR